MKHASKTVLALVLGLALSVLASSAGLAGGTAPTLKTTGYSISENVVVVTVANTSAATKAGTVVVEAILNGSKTMSTQSVQVPPGASANVTVAFPMAVASVSSLGITDDVSPF